MSKFVKILLPLVGDEVSLIPGSIVELENEVADELIEAEQAVLQEAIIPDGEMNIDSCGIFNVGDKKTVNDHKGLYVNYYIKGSAQPFHCLTAEEYLDYFTLPANKMLLGWTRDDQAAEAEDLDNFRPVEDTDLYAVFGGEEGEIVEPEEEEQEQNQ